MLVEENPFAYPELNNSVTHFIILYVIQSPAVQSQSEIFAMMFIFAFKGARRARTASP